MSTQPPSKTGQRRPRPRRGRPTSGGTPGSRRRGGPTLARLLAVRVLERVERVRAFADLSLHHALATTELSGTDRALATEIVYGTLRWRGRIDFMLSHVLDRDLKKLEPLVGSILRAGAYQILFADRIPESAAVDESVRCARSMGAERATGLINAVLRRLAREHQEIVVPTLESQPLEHLIHGLSLPPWIAQRWLDRFGVEDAAALARVSNAPPPRTVRANRLRNTADELLAKLLPNFPEACRANIAPDGIILGPGANPGRDPGFLAGDYTIQDEASQLVVELLDPQPGERVLDTCAAPGTKATAIAERTGDSGSVMACDRHAGRLRLAARDARRLLLSNLETRARDATQPLEDLILTGGEGFDRVLVDAPCSGLGSLRRNPDARWRIQESAVGALAKQQRALLDQAARVVRPGGTLVYSTCTILAEENEDIVESLLQEHPEFTRTPREALPSALEPALREDGTLECLPHVHGSDGFYAVRLDRTAQETSDG